MPSRKTLMKRTGCAVILALMLMTGASAQESSDFTVFASSGVVLPSSPMAFANYWKMQYGGGVGVGYALTSSVTLMGSFEYYRFKLDEQGIQDGFDTQYMRDIWLFTDVTLHPSAAASSVKTISANLRMVPSASSRIMTPYGLAGVGLMSFAMAEIVVPTTNVITIDGTEIPFTADRTISGGTMTAAYIQLGLGAEFDIITLIKPFVEARYVLGMTKGMRTIYIPLTAGVKVQL
jgi:opacity protein-like surface antigen